MKPKYKIPILPLFLLIIMSVLSCENEVEKKKDLSMNYAKTEYEKYVSYKLESNTDHLSDNQKLMLEKLFSVAKIMNKLFQYEVMPNYDEMYNSLTDDFQKNLFVINYGPWNRLDNNKSFIDGVGEKPKGANFYPSDMTKDEFEAWNDKEKASLYTFIRRNDKGELISIPYHVIFKDEVKEASKLLLEAAELAESNDFKKYLKLRAAALLNDDYLDSDMAWMDMKDNMIDFVVGPIENYEDQLFAYKTAHEAFILIKDLEWTEKLAKYASYLPVLQKGLPVDEKYKTEEPGTDSDLGAYDVVFYQGDCNSGSKTIAINLPNDERVQLAKGSRRLQLKNAMKAKFDNIMLPIADVLIDDSQKEHVKFDAFFANTMFHEVAHGLGIKKTINGKGSARLALKEQYSGLEEGKADILGLYMVDQLIKMGVHEGNIKDNMVTFMAGIFRSIRFGASSAHGRANLMRFNYFAEKGAFSQNNDGKYTINFEKMEEAMNSLSDLIITLQGNGDYDGVVELMKKYGIMGEELQKSLNRLNEANIPVDVTWEQGKEVLFK